MRNLDLIIEKHINEAVEGDLFKDIIDKKLTIKDKDEVLKMIDNKEYKMTNQFRHASRSRVMKMKTQKEFNDWLDSNKHWIDIM